jgi:hypothetical protein
MRLAPLALAAALAACSPYVKDESSAAAGASAPGSLFVRFNPDNGGPERILPTDYPDFQPGDRAQVLPNGKVAPM